MIFFLKSAASDDTATHTKHYLLSQGLTLLQIPPTKVLMHVGACDSIQALHPTVLRMSRDNLVGKAVRGQTVENLACDVA